MKTNTGNAFNKTWRQRARERERTGKKGSINQTFLWTDKHTL